MSSNAEFLLAPGQGAFKSNLTCFTAMVMWSFAFPVAEIMLDSWGSIALVLARQGIAVLALFVFWLWLDGLSSVLGADWRRGIGVGGIGFGFGSMLFLVGQSLSDAVTPAIAASMMPIFGAVLEVLFDDRRLRPKLLLGILCALGGGLLATGARLDQGDFGWGSLLCLLSVILFTWGTRSTTRSFPGLSSVGQTTITMAGSLVVVIVTYLAILALDLPAATIGSLDTRHCILLLATSVGSLGLAQFLWIRGASGLGILQASLHMNAVPFYVMVCMLLFLGGDWNWSQAGGAALVACGVLLAQASTRRALRRSSA